VAGGIGSEDNSVGNHLQQRTTTAGPKPVLFRKAKGPRTAAPTLTYDITRQDNNTHQDNITQQDNKFTITVHAGALARFVNISVGEENIIFSDNYFDLLPGQPRRITFQSALPPERIKQDIRIISLKDSLDN